MNLKLFSINKNFMQLFKQGAEAKLFKQDYLGRQAVVKVREKKAYREELLDKKIIRERIRMEANLLARAKKAGIRTPIVWKIDLKELAITTEFISGKTLKEELLSGTKNAKKFCTDAGKIVGKMHSNDLVHGDLTTSNIILHNGVLVFLDFGLGSVSTKIEDKAVDLLVFKKTFLATHYRIESHWKSIEKAYSSSFSGGKQVLKHLEGVEARARYY